MSGKTRIIRKVVRIDEERCTGCGVCVPACAEGALQIVDGKARLVGDRYCDGLGACLGECPEGAITIEEREAEEFTEVAVAHHAGGSLPCGCPSSSVTSLERGGAGVCRGDAARGPAADGCGAAAPDWSPKLSHWPVQLALVPPGAPFLKGADVVLTADCVPFAYARFHPDFLEDHAVMVACPKLDDFEAHQARLTEVLRRSGVRSITVARMEVPCCSGLTHMAQEAIRRSGQRIPLDEVVIGIRGNRVA